MRFITRRCLVLVALVTSSSLLAAPVTPQQGTTPGGGVTGGGGQGGHVNGGVKGTAAIAFTIPPAGAGQWWLNPIGTFSASNCEPIIGGGSFEVRQR